MSAHSHKRTFEDLGGGQQIAEGGYFLLGSYVVNSWREVKTWGEDK